jgi:hypothetical protein
MTHRHELDLLENACDSLNESLRRFEDGNQDRPREYKFAILHFSHFIELLFKYYVTQSHDLLIYRNPFSKNLAKEQTIGLWDALQFLKNEGHPLDEQMVKDLEWIKKLRNQIEHYKFEMDVREVRRTLGRLIQATNALNDELQFFDLTKKIDPECLETFTTLADEYLTKRVLARQEASEDAPDGEVADCSWCGELGTAFVEDHEVCCKFCDYKDKMVSCCQCGEEYPSERTITWNDDHPPHIDYICEFCHDHIMSLD